MDQDTPITYPRYSTGRPMPLDADEVLIWLDQADDDSLDWFYDLLVG